MENNYDGGLEWESVTTGGFAGMILEFEDRDAGELEIHWTDGGEKKPERNGVHRSCRCY